MRLRLFQKCDSCGYAEKYCFYTLSMYFRGAKSAESVPQQIKGLLFTKHSQHICVITHRLLKCPLTMVKHSYQSVLAKFHWAGYECVSDFIGQNVNDRHFAFFSFLFFSFESIV